MSKISVKNKGNYYDDRKNIMWWPDTSADTGYAIRNMAVLIDRFDETRKGNTEYTENHGEHRENLCALRGSPCTPCYPYDLQVGKLSIRSYPASRN